MASNNSQQQQSSVSPPLVWFQLYDSATGLLYKKTTSDFVLLPSTALLVYKNKAAFDKRNAAVDEEKEVPLEEDSLIGGFGTSKKEALVVVVPSSAENSSGKFNDSSSNIILAIRDLTLEIRENNKFLKKTGKNDFRLLKPKSYISDNHDIRLQWLIHYGMVSSTSTDLPQNASCHLLGVQVPLNINSGENILILLKIFEEAFDASRFVLLVDKQTGLIRCKIIDYELKNKKLDESMKDLLPKYQIGEVIFDGKTCFGDFDGQEHTERAVLSFHALVAREHAIDYGWIGENELKEVEDDDMWSDGFLDEKTRKFIDEWRVDVCSQLSTN